MCITDIIALTATIIAIVAVAKSNLTCRYFGGDVGPFKSKMGCIDNIIIVLLQSSRSEIANLPSSILVDVGPF